MVVEEHVSAELETTFEIGTKNIAVTEEHVSAGLETTFETGTKNIAVAEDCAAMD